ncbi:hypothetical protein PsYK624_031150 [Phanerochaete sordida]|uniref:Uncharacterized protein n=1 Tax=Phanerochaete sordida TaxID=48140 RepID=A0A9P3G2R0_9APHY|nr:hypothetical protein PsYK624_031150 [Phanerochaete sordida]
MAHSRCVTHALQCVPALQLRLPREPVDCVLGRAGHTRRDSGDFCVGRSLRRRALVFPSGAHGASHQSSAAHLRLMPDRSTVQGLTDRSVEAMPLARFIRNRQETIPYCIQDGVPQPYRWPLGSGAGEG